MRDSRKGLLCIILGFVVWIILIVLKMPDFAYVVPGIKMSFGLLLWGRLIVKTLGESNIWYLGLIGTILLILGTAYYAVHIFPPGNAEPPQPSSIAIVRGMGHFPSDHIIIPIEWRNSRGQPTIVRNLTLTLIDKSGSLPNLSYELAGELAKDYSENIGYVGESYTLKQAYVIDPNTITQTFMVFHIHNWWDPDGPNWEFQFKTLGNYEVMLNYSHTSFSDLFGKEDSGTYYNKPLFDMPIRKATVDLNEDNNRWDTYSTYTQR